MKSVSLNGIARVNLGKKFSKKIRKEESVPCVIYGGEKGPIHISLKSNELRKVIYSPNVFILNLMIGDEKYDAIIRDIQFHPIKDHVLHVDFLQLHENKEISLEVPVKLNGNSIGVRNGGVLNLILRKLLIKSFPKNIPDQIEIDINDLRIGESVRIDDLPKDNYSFLSSLDSVIVAVKTARNIIEEEEEEEETEGEVGEETGGETGGESGGESGGDKKEDKSSEAPKE